MRLTKFSDYAFRVLLFAAVTPESTPGRNLTIEETANAYGISRAHLKKVVLLLAHKGFLKGMRGRSGGFTLGMAPDQINLGAVLRATEPDFALVECFSSDNHCKITCQCKLPVVVNKARNAFIMVFDAYTLQDMMVDPAVFSLMRDSPVPVQPERGPNLPEAPKIRPQSGA